MAASGLVQDLRRRLFRRVIVLSLAGMALSALAAVSALLSAAGESAFESPLEASRWEQGVDQRRAVEQVRRLLDLLMPRLY